MKANNPRDESVPFAVYESVRCLDCGIVYSKPARGGTTASNPGCPECGYVGWISVTVPIGERAARSRSSGDQPPRRSAQSG